jgi:2-dehydropantoate 2-reductase
MSDEGAGMTIGVLGPGGVGGLIAGALDRAGAPVTVVARKSTAAIVGERGLRVRSISLGQFTARPRAVDVLRERVDVLIVATKAAGVPPALERIEMRPGVVLPLLNGLEHVALLREHFGHDRVLAGAIRIEADRPEPGVIVHTSPFLRVDMAFGEPAGPGVIAAPVRQDGAASATARALHLAETMRELVQTLERAGVPARVLDSEAQVMWSKLVRLNALACVTSAYDVLLGEIRSTPALRAELRAAIEEGCAVGQAEGAADVEPAKAIAELEQAHDTLGSSMQRDIAAGRAPELDAIAGSVLRAAARHRMRCATIERLAGMIAVRAGIAAPVAAA